jgi:hypothetical protein
LEQYCVNGTGVYIFHNCCNHNCKASVITVCDRRDNIISVYSLKHLKKGEEINISYLGNQNLSFEERQKILIEKYSFVCNCELCKNKI